MNTVPEDDQSPLHPSVLAAMDEEVMSLVTANALSPEAWRTRLKESKERATRELFDGDRTAQIVAATAHAQYVAAIRDRNPAAAGNACVMSFIAAHAHGPFYPDGTPMPAYREFADRLREDIEERLQLEADQRAAAAEDHTPHEF